MFKFVHHLVTSQNQFTSGGLLLMLFGSIAVFVRELPTQIGTWLLSQVTLVVTVKDDDNAFEWVKEWFLEQPFLTRIRHVDLDTTLRGTELALIPAPGTHLFWLQGRPFWVTFYRNDQGTGRMQRRVESLAFRTIGRRQDRLRRFVAQIVASHHRRSALNSSLHVFDEYWTSVQAYAPRLLDSIILSPGDKESLCEDLERFRASRERYRHLGVPYHRGYLFYGPPGTGKTSLVSALASAFGLSIYVLNLTGLNDRTLKAAMNEVPENSVILFEDIDCMSAGHRRNSGPSSDSPSAPSATAAVTLSGLLNVLDGFHAPENVIFVMTTNDVEALDPALLRPGRIDYRLYLGHATHSQKLELYRRFFPDSPPSEASLFAHAHATETMAEFQGRLLQLQQHPLQSAPRDLASSARGHPAHTEDELALHLSR